jgi:aryl carrier-like protein
MQQYSHDEVRAILLTEISKETSISISELHDHENFINFGLDSVNCIFLLDRLEKIFKLELNPVWFWDYPTIDSMAQKIFSELPQLQS